MLGETTHGPGLISYAYLWPCILTSPHIRTLKIDLRCPQASLFLFPRCDHTE